MEVSPPDSAVPGPAAPQAAQENKPVQPERSPLPSHARPGRRQRSVRALLAMLFVVPLASLLALWGFAASVTVSNAIQEHNFNTENRLYGGWAQAVITQVAQERLQSFQWLSTGRRSPRAALLAQQSATNAAVNSFRRGLNSSPGLIQPSARPALDDALAALGRLGRIRAAIGSGHMTALAAFQAYNAIVDAQFRLYGDLVVVNDTPLYQQAIASVDAGRALELAAREVTLVSGAIVANGRMSTPERIQFAQIVANQRLLIGDALKQLNASLGSGYQHAYASPAYASFAAIENQIVNSIGSRAPLPVNPLAFGVATIPLFKDFQAAEAQNRLALSRLGTDVGNRLLLEVLLAGGVGLIAVALSVYLMLRFGRRISRELTGLQGAALKLATDRLPRVVERLSHGEEVDVAAEAAPPAPGRIAEITKVAAAFASVQRTAIEAAVGQARLRRGVSQVFRNLAWRSQSLLHRQLSLLDAMERRSSEPETLAELFQLDHLTTRMRRHAEGLIILSGSAPGRGWRDPVPVVDVLRGALAEVEDYTRVNVITESGDAVVGAAVADVIHLLAELIENATAYSPPNTEVTVRADRVANGFVVEVEDRGIGISGDELTAVNDRLANPPEFDLAESDRLGLFVVARLATKHRIKIVLRPSAYGGTTAIVLLPHAIVVARETLEAASDVTSPGGTPLPAAPRRAAVTSPAIAHSTILALGRPAPRVVSAPRAGAAPRPDAGPTADAAPRADAGPTADAAPRADAGPTADAAPRADAGPTADAAPRADAGPTADAGQQAGAPAVGSMAPPVDADAADVSDVGMQAGLPRRVRQASLAPQLRNGGPAAAGDAPSDAAGGRTPAESRALFESLQRGWQRARNEADPSESPG
jgi:signal transduction histidine kinase